MFCIQLAEQGNALIVVEFLQDIGEIDGMDFREFFLQYIEFYIAAEGTDVIRQLLDIARALMFAAEYKSPDEPLEHFIRRHGGINLCAAELSRLSRSQSPTR
jgi:hypothetical protein